MREDELYLQKDPRFRGILENVKFLQPRHERIKMLDEFWSRARRGRDRLRAFPPSFRR
jgi:hypothetical protein